jgi:DNA invertase Pin-like site-specific DNA recombinase
MSREASCLRFLESQTKKYIEFLRAGDLASSRNRKCRKTIDEEFAAVKRLIAKGVTRKEAAAIVGMNYQTLTKRLNNGK